MNLEELLPHFPFPEIRDSQKQALEKFVDTTNKDRKFTILELPTGTGKSGVAVSLGRWAGEAGAYLLTIQKMLQAQYLNEFTDLVELKGASNYRCQQFETNCEEGSQLSKFFNGGSCSCDCPYRGAKDIFINTPFGVTNFAYFCTAVAHQKGLFKPRKLLIIDEAHNTESVLIGHSAIEITQHRASEVGFAFPSSTLGSRDLEGAKKWIRGTVLPAINLRLESIKLELNHKEASVSSLLRQQTGLSQFEQKLQMFLQSDSEKWFIGHQLDRIEIKPLTGELFADSLLFSQADHVVFLSATILDPRTFVRNLGLQPKQCGYLGLPSEFPAENRRVVFSPAGSMSFKNYDQTLPKLLTKLDRIFLKHPSEKGIVHCQSYKTMQHVANHFSRSGHAPRIISHDPSPASKQRALAQHMNSSDPTILLSPSMQEGLDLKDELSRFQVVAKMPFASLADPYVKARMEVDKDWYKWTTALTLLQSLGRSVRSKDDYATSYIIDKDFQFFLTTAQDILPDWWLESIEFK